MNSVRVPTTEITKQTTDSHNATEIEVNAQTEIALMNYDPIAIKAKKKNTRS